MVEPLRLGERLRQIRQAQRWTLEEVSRRTGLARSTLSKIENEQMSPSFDAVQRLAAGLGIDVPQLFVSIRANDGIVGRRSLTRAHSGQPHPTTTYEHELLCTDLANKKMVPFKTRVRARSFAEFGDWVRHPGEEFLYVLEGQLSFLSEFYVPLALSVGDSVYYDSGMGHCCISTGAEDALILWVSAL
ncbi:MAG: helix-turn-helix domain-containing protein [Geminicoccaceae bacterium]